MEKKFIFNVKVSILAVFSIAAIFALPAFSQDAVSDIAGYATVRFEKRPADSSAVLNKIAGFVFVRKSGGALWMEAVEGQYVGNGDEVRTGIDSSVTIKYSNSGSVTLGAQSSAIAGSAVDPESGIRVGVFALDSGKVWLDVDTQGQTGGEMERLVFRAGDSFLDTRNVKGFYEISDNKTMCVDLFSGSLNYRSKNNPAEIMRIGSEERMKVDLESFETRKLTFDDSPDKFDSSYSCMEQLVRAVESSGFDYPLTVIETGSTDEETETYLISANGVVSFISEETAASAQSSMSEDTSGNLVFTVEDSVKESTDSGTAQQIEYEEVVITTSVTATFKNKEQPVVVTTAPAAVDTPPVADTTTPVAETGTSVTTVAAEPCRELPVISEVTLDEKSESSGNSEDIVAQNCAGTAVIISGKASAACGTISKLVATYGTTTIAVTGAASWAASIALSTGKFPFQIYAVDTAGNRSEVFALTLNYMIEQPEPEASIQTIAKQTSPGPGSRIVINRDKLESGKLVLTGDAESNGCSVSKVEISINGGVTWGAAAGTNLWTYSFTPSQGVYQVLSRATDNLGKQSPDFIQPVEVEYNPLTDEDSLRIAFEAMIKAYKDKSASNFMESVYSSFSSNYDSIEDYSSLDNSLNSKFAAVSSISLKHRIDTLTVSGNEGRVGFSWDANPNALSYSNYGTFIFIKDEKWKLNTVNDDRTFLRHTSQAGTVTVTTSATTLIANQSDTTTVTVTAKDSSGAFVRDGTTVTLAATTGSFTPSTIETTGGAATSIYTASAIPGAVTITASVGGVSATAGITLQPEHAPLPPP